MRSRRHKAKLSRYALLDSLRICCSATQSAGNGRSGKDMECQEIAGDVMYEEKIANLYIADYPGN